MKTKYYITNNDVVNPELCYIKDWNINLSLRKGNTISISYYNNTVYSAFNSIHNVYHRKYCNEQDYLDLRLWIDEKIICLWTYNIDNIVNIISNIQEKLENVDYIGENYKPIKIDLSEYDVIFTVKDNDNKIKIVKCSLQEFYNYPDFNILDNLYQRQYHIFSPVDKMKIKNTFRFKKKKKRYFDEANKKWKDKIGDMDVAQYHMLIYGE